jgi:hypothetical protein
MMSGYKEQDFNERRSSAAEAKRTLLEKYKVQTRPDDPAVIERRAARQALVAAREARLAERKAAREQEAKRLAEEKAAREALLKAEEAERIKAEEAARIELLARQKAARDARYAARKAHKR